MSKPIRDPLYLAWIRAQPCCVLLCQARYVEAAHVGPHGLGQKSSDRSTIPLCIRHHRTGRDSYHRLGPRKFASVHNLDIAAVVRRLNTKPTIRIEGGRFVARLEEQEYTLSRVESGIELAVRNMLQVCHDHQLAQRGAYE